MHYFRLLFSERYQSMCLANTAIYVRTCEGDGSVCVILGRLFVWPFRFPSAQYRQLVWFNQRRYTCCNISGLTYASGIAFRLLQPMEEARYRKPHQQLLFSKIVYTLLYASLIQAPPPPPHVPATTLPPTSPTLAK